MPASGAALAGLDFGGMLAPGGHACTAFCWCAGNSCISPSTLCPCTQHAHPQTALNICCSMHQEFHSYLSWPACSVQLCPPLGGAGVWDGAESGGGAIYAQCTHHTSLGCTCTCGNETRQNMTCIHACHVPNLQGSAIQLGSTTHKTHKPHNTHPHHQVERVAAMSLGWDFTQMLGMLLKRCMPILTPRQCTSCTHMGGSGKLKGTS